MPLTDDASEGREARLAWAVTLAAALAAGVLAAFVVDARYSLNWDGGMYLELAESVGSGRGYAYQGVDHAKLPPVYPVLLAAAGRVAGAFGLADARPEAGLLVEKLVGVAGLVASVLLVGRLALRRRRPLAFAVGAALGAVSWWQIWQLDFVLAEPVYAAFQAGAMLAAVAWGADADWKARGVVPRRAAAAFAACAALAVLTRTVGVAVAVAGLAHVAATGAGAPTTRLRALAAYAAAPVAAFVGWRLWGAFAAPAALPPELFETRDYGRWIVTPSGDYAGRLDAAGVAARAVELASGYWRRAGALLSSETPRVGLVAAAVVAAGLCAALWRGLRRERDVVSLVVLFTAASYLAYTWGGDRFLSPLLPLVAALGVEAVTDAAASAQAKFLRPRTGAAAAWATWVPVAAVVACLAPFAARRVVVGLRADAELEARGGARPEYRNACRWLREHAAPGDVIVNDEASNAAWLTGRTAWSYPLVRDDAAIRAGIAAVGARWLLHEEGREWNGRPRLPRDLADATAPGTRVAWREGGVRVIELRPPR